MQKIYFEEQQTNNLRVPNNLGKLSPIISDNVLYVEEIKYILKFNLKEKNQKVTPEENTKQNIKKYAFYINNAKLFLKISYFNGTSINNEELKAIILFLFDGENVLSTKKQNFALIPLKGKYLKILKKIQENLNLTVDLEVEKIGKTGFEQQSQQVPEQATQQTDSANKNNQQQQASEAPQTPQTTKSKEEVAKIILDNFKTKITDQKMMEKVNIIDFNNTKDNDLNSLYIKYLTFLYLNNTKELEVIKKMIKDKKGKPSKGLPPKAFISKYGQFIFSGLPNAETIEEIKKNINTYFENENDYDFFGELKHTDLFLERYLKG